MGVMKELQLERVLGRGNIRARTSMFFDRKAVVDAIGQAAANGFMLAGGRIMGTARQSIRKAKSPSKAGHPPHSHKGTLKAGRYGILFFYDPQTRSMVVGPEAIPNFCDVPRTLEKGGVLPRRYNGRRITRFVGGSGEIRTDGPACLTTKPTKDWKGKTRQVTYARLYSAAQAARANQLNEELYGPSLLPEAYLEARPYMGPALKKTLPELPPMWADSVR